MSILTRCSLTPVCSSSARRPPPSACRSLLSARPPLPQASTARSSFLRRLNRSGYGINSVAFWSSLFWGFAAFMAFIAMAGLAPRGEGFAQSCVSPVFHPETSAMVVHCCFAPLRHRRNEVTKHESANGEGAVGRTSRSAVGDLGWLALAEAVPATALHWLVPEPTLLGAHVSATPSAEALGFVAVASFALRRGARSGRYLATQSVCHLQRPPTSPQLYMHAQAPASRGRSVFATLATLVAKAASAAAASAVASVVAAPGVGKGNNLGRTYA